MPEYPQKQNIKTRRIYLTIFGDDPNSLRKKINKNKMNINARLGGHGPNAPATTMDCLPILNISVSYFAAIFLLLSAFCIACSFLIYLCFLPTVGCWKPSIYVRVQCRAASGVFRNPRKGGQASGGRHYPTQGRPQTLKCYRQNMKF